MHYPALYSCTSETFPSSLSHDIHPADALFTHPKFVLACMYFYDLLFRLSLTPTMKSKFHTFLQKHISTLSKHAPSVLLHKPVNILPYLPYLCAPAAHSWLALCGFRAFALLDNDSHPLPSFISPLLRSRDTSARDTSVASDAAAPSDPAAPSFQPLLPWVCSSR